MIPGQRTRIPHATWGGQKKIFLIKIILTIFPFITDKQFRERYFKISLDTRVSHQILPLCISASNHDSYYGI